MNQGHHQYPRGPVPPVPGPYPASYPMPVLPAPPAARQGGMSASSVALVAVVAVLSTLAVVALAFLVVPQLTASAPSVAAPVPSAPALVAPVPASGATTDDPSSTSDSYSCGTANGYAIRVESGNVPCSSAQWVTTMWTTDATTPGDGDGPAGTPYSWTCAGGSSSVGVCTSKMGSRFTIS